MKLIIISDTHGKHQGLGTLSGDILIHCGDIENMFQTDENAIQNLDNWFGRQNFKHILCIAGNHDLSLKNYPNQNPFKNANYLQDAEFIYKGIKFYGAPWVPVLRDHAFFADDPTLKQAWAKIPKDVDVLITHTPPAKILDVSSRGLVLGCKHLSKRLKRLNPILHCFGHVHASAGIRVLGKTTYVNASSVDSSFNITNAAVEFEIELHKKRAVNWQWWPFNRT